jgi:6-pyruvoyltetrahydropterin/6-carboxytetrahydropterin synthase
MYTITKEFHFSASHQLTTLPPEHQCARLHGHNYVVELALQADTVDEHGFVVDYIALKSFKDYIDQELVHRHLNDLMDCPTSAENIARHLFEWAKGQWREVSAVRVSETPKTWAEYRQS